MNTKHSTANGRRQQWGQGMTEFALALPIFLILVVGVIEIGHLLYLYSSVYAGAREAARYGASVSEDPGINRFADCAGIRNQARRIAFLSGLADGQIEVEFDNPDYPSLPVLDCADIAANTTLVGLGQNQYNRINVTITTDYQALIPIINFPEMPIQTRVGRTIIRELYFRDYTGQQAIPGTTVTPPTAPVHCPKIVFRDFDEANRTVEFTIDNNASGSELQIIDSITFFWVQENHAHDYYRLMQVDYDPEERDAAIATPIPTPIGVPSPAPHLWYSDTEDLQPMTELPYEYRLNAPWYDRWPAGLEDYTRVILPETTTNKIKIYFSEAFNMEPGISVEINFITPDGDKDCFGIDDLGAIDL